MRSFNLQEWQINIKNKGTDIYDYICDSTKLVILDSRNEYVAFVFIKENGDLVLEHLPYWIHYKIHFCDKMLFIELD